MSNINVRVVGTANVTQMSGAFSKLEAQVTALNAQLAQMVALQNGVDPSGYERMTKAAAQNSKTFRNAAASTGMFEVQQLKLNRASDDYVQNLQKQRLSFRQLAQQRKVAAQAFREQLAMQNMVIRQNEGSTIHGKNMFDVVYPKQFSAELNTAGQRLTFLSEQLKSGAHQMVNWGKNTQWAGRQLMVGFTMPIAAFGAAAGVMAYQVDKELTRIAKVYDTTATTGIAREKELMAVRKQSMETAVMAAKTYGSAGTDTLNVQAELAATGLKGAELQGYTNEIMRISTLGELEYADSIKSAISLQAVFGMSTRELTDSFNYMNAVENATSLQTKDFAAAIPIAAAPVKQFGGDVKELGVLLTAMKERGIEATQGANAIKAAMQRLGRPSKQIQEEWTALTNTDITKIFDDSKSLTDLFSQIGDATENLTDKEKIKAFAGLFGTYQVTRMSALVDGMKDLENGTGQVSKAAELAGSSFSDLAKVAEQELAQQAESISGKWDRAFQEMKLQLSTLGKPFLQVATVVVQGLAKIIETFNSFPHFVKVIAAVGIGLGALAGPAIMLAGLFGNLFAQGLSAVGTFMGAIGRLMGGMKSMTVEQKVADLAADAHAASMTNEATAAEMLTMHLGKLTAAMNAANAERAESRIMALTAGGMDPDLARYTVERDAATQAASNSTAVIANNTQQMEGPTKRSAVSWGKIAAGAGLAATAGATMLMTQEGIVGNIAEVVFYASMLGPLVTMIGPVLGKGFKAAWVWAKATGIEMKKNLGIALATAKANAMGSLSSLRGGGIKGAATGVKGIVGGMVNFVGKTNLAIAGILALGYGYSKIKEHQAEIAQQQREQADAIVSQNNLLAESLDIRIRKQKQLNLLSATGTRPGEKTSMELADELNSTDEGKALVAAYKSDDASETEKRAIAIAKYNEVLNATGGSARKARTYLEAMFMAAGEGALEAQTHATEYFSELGSYISNDELTGGFADMITAAAEGSSERVDAIGTDLGKDLADAMANASSGSDKIAIFDNVANSLQDTWSTALDGISTETRDMLASVGVETAPEMKKFISQYQQVVDGMMTKEDFEATYGLNFKDVFMVDDMYMELNSVLDGSNLAAKNLQQTEKQIVKELASQLGIEREIASMKELKQTWEFKLATASKGTASSLYQQEIATRNQNLAAISVFGTQMKLTKEKKLELLNQMRLNIGLKETGNLADGFGRATRDINGNLITQGQKHDENNAKLRTQLALAGSLKGAFAGINLDGFVSSVQAGMENVQQGIADDMRASFDSQMNHALESRQSMWDHRVEQVNAANERASRGLDAKWENKRDAAEAYWDRRTEGVNKAIEAEEKAEEKRQKMFDAEIARINKLNEAMNRNIDFNVALNEGNFDEAAKIRNDVSATDAATALERAAGAGADKSDKRIKKLENRLDSIEKARERAMKAMEKQEAAEKRHLEKVSAMREEAIQHDMEVDMEAQRETWELRKASLEDQLGLFMAFIAGGEKGLKKHMENVGLDYDKFEKDVITKKGDSWGNYFGEKLREGMREHGLKLANDSMWSTVGKSASQQLLKSMGFGSMADFRYFVMTGKFRTGQGSKGGGAGGKNESRPEDTGMGPQTLHEGGEVGSGFSSRKGVARTAKRHASEQMIRAQKGEFVVNRDAAAKNMGVLHSINSGQNVSPDAKPVGGRGGTGTFGGAGLMSGVLAAMMINGVKNAAVNAYDKRVAKMSKQASVSGSYSAGAAGVYSDRSFGPEQLKNAAIIANVGSGMGMSARDIQIGIMTAITESGLVNVQYGDRDSLGLFQQRPSMGWGTAAQVTDPRYAATKFFSALRGVQNRGDMSPWLAAQAVQRSYDSTGSNYRQYWDNANAIFKNGLVKDKAGNWIAQALGGGFTQGTGGWHKPSVPGKGWSNTHDYRNGLGSPLYAASDGVITDSRAITSGGSPGNGLYSTPYRSYGETIAMRTSSGDILRYAHLNPGARYVRVGQTVKGGALIGRSGQTGNASGPHTHFDVNGNYNASGWMQAHGISLSKGAANVKWDNTIANLHKGEAVLTEDLNKKFHQGVNNFANGGNNEYNVNVKVEGTNASVEEITDAVMKGIKRAEARKPKSRRG